MPASARRYRLSLLAESDLEEIWLHSFRNWSPEQADRYHRDLVAVFEGLAAGRKTGRAVDIRDGYLKYAVAAHVVYYRLSDSSLDVVRVLHQRMDATRHL